MRSLAKRESPTTFYPKLDRHISYVEIAQHLLMNPMMQQNDYEQLVKIIKSLERGLTEGRLPTSTYVDW